MARVVLASWGSYGDLFPSVGIALELKRRGHRPLLATCGFFRPVVEGLGLDFHAVPPDLDPEDTQVITRIMHPRTGPQYFIRDLIMPAAREIYRALDAAAAGADLLVTHPATFVAPLMAEKRGLPWISTVLAPMSFFSPHDFPVLPGRLGGALYPRLGPGFCGFLRRIAKWSTRNWDTPVKELRVELGLPRGENPLFEGQFSPLGTLALFPAPLMQPQPDWPPAVTRTGFVSYSGPDPLAPELEAFLASGPPPIAFTLGSSAVGIPGTFFTESAAAAAMIGQRAVLMVGRTAANRPTGPLPGGVIAVEFAPHAALFPRCSAVVHQCGMGTLSQALRAGKPQLAVPFANDQPDNAARVNRLGVARVCTPRRYRRDRVAAHLRELLGQAQYAASAEAVGHVVRREDGAGAACDAIEAVLHQGRKPP